MRFTGFVLLLLLLAGLAAAQPMMGDIVACEKKPLGHIVSIDRSTSQMTTIRKGPLPSIRACLGLTMAANNTDMFLLEEGGPSFSLWTVSPTGVLATFAPVSAVGDGAPTSCDLLQDGKIVVTSAVYKARDYLRILDPATRKLTSLYTASPSSSYYYEVTRNPDNNRLLVCGTSASGLLEYDLATSTMRTLAAGIGGSNSVQVEPSTGNLICSAGGKILVITPQGTVQKTITVGTGAVIRRLKIDPASGVYFCGAGTSTGAVNRILEVDGKKGKVIRQHGPYTGFNFTGLDFYGSRQVVGRGPATPGSTYNVDFCFPGLPGHNYVAVLSFGQRPGIDLNGSKVNIAFDGLFLASLQGLFVKNFQGTLNTSARAFGSIALPSYAPKGFTIYCTAVATNGTAFVTGNTIGIAIQ